MQSESNANGAFRQTEWQSVDWRNANRLVNNLRQRIFRASKENTFKKVVSLQKLLLRSQANILVSIRRVTQTNKGKNTAGIDKVVVKIKCSPKGRPKFGQFKVVSAASFKPCR